MPQMVKHCDINSGFEFQSDFSECVREFSIVSDPSSYLAMITSRMKNTIPVYIATPAHWHVANEENA